MLNSASQIANPWHGVSAQEALSGLQVSLEDGLSPEEVENRLKVYGPNVIKSKPGKSFWLRLLLQFHQPLIYIMNASGIVAAFLGEWVDASVIFGVVLLNAMIGLIQESKATQALESLAKTITTHASVVRGGKRMRILSTDLVPGDIVELNGGDRVPADLRLLQARNLQVDESQLTGESVSVEKSPAPLEGEITLAERKNMLYSSTLVATGHGMAVVVATGEQTEIGRISHLLKTAQDLDTPLTRKIDAFSTFLLYVILAFAILSAVIGIYRGQSWMEMLMAAVAISVGAIPEGLPAAVTITLAIGVYRMAKRRAIVRKLAVVESLGSTTVICSDKTGTLTENQMTTQKIAIGKTIYDVTGGGYSAQGEILKDGKKEHVRSQSDPGLLDCLQAGLLCNLSLLVEDAKGWHVEGDPTEGALIVAAKKAGLIPEDVHRQYPRMDAIPFESENRFMATLHDTPEGKSKIVFLKGAVEAVLNRCTLSDETRNMIHQQFTDMAGKGLRVLAFGKREMSEEVRTIAIADVGSEFTFLGLQAMLDPPRPEAVSAIQKCKDAGIQVKMITGDHALTALVIAQKMGLEEGFDATENVQDKVYTGHELEKLSDEELQKVAQESCVFARVTPEQKYRLVKSLQAAGHLVAMTGDGVNDAPALKQADIGIAMGVKGTEVAKNAADMVLLDDNFATLEAAVEEGRGVFDNITKFIIWTLPTNLGQGLVIMAAIFMNVELPILPVQILWLNMTTAVFLGLMLAFEPKEAGIMKRAPRNPKQAILSQEIVGRIVLVGVFLLVASFGLFLWEKQGGSSIQEARTVAVNVFVMVMTFYLFNCRSLTQSMFQVGLFSNLWVIGGVSLTWGLQLLYTYAPFMNRLFQSAPIDGKDWGWILLASFATYLAVGTEKWFRRNWSPGRFHLLKSNG